jgi:hypothetical protein
VVGIRAGADGEMVDGGADDFRREKEREHVLAPCLFDELSTKLRKCTGRCR